MTRKTIALVTGDGSGPEMMKVACAVAIEAAKKDGIEITFEETPMGWNAFKEHGDTRPEETFSRAVKIGTIFFGGVGDPKLDNTIGKEKPEMKPEARCLLKLRSEMGLLLNFRPVTFYPELKYLAKLRSDLIPDRIIKQTWVRFLLQDSYFGNADLKELLGPYLCWKLGIIDKSEITGNEERIVDLAYYSREMVIKYMEVIFEQARQFNLPVISVDKANVIPRYQYWRMITQKMQELAYPDISVRHEYSDATNCLLFEPDRLNGIIACGNEHGDILSDGAIASVGSMGMMCSSAINPDTGAAMFESGAGTAPTLAGQNKANPIGRTLTAAMMLRHIGTPRRANAIENAVNQVLQDGYRTQDIFSTSDDPTKLLGTYEMGEKILEALNNF